MLRLQLVKDKAKDKVLPYCIINTQLFFIPTNFIGKGMSQIIGAWGTGELKLIPMRQGKGLNKKFCLTTQLSYSDKQATKFIKAYLNN